ncbi:hypothetical protein O181_026531 [Austropuccinia psidii MF-1]|uniref:Uncharacterized protein n=1 Tax=Austropuccinia psidii MF-1 TaxID=1389203 RepID=A0A9Q3CQM4_9BASI|nr:hypothetical protein [Austropuccinia psidii MF-1]
MKLVQLILFASLFHLKPAFVDGAPTSSLIGARSKLPVHSYQQFNIKEKTSTKTASQLGLNQAELPYGRPWFSSTHSSSGAVGGSKKRRSVLTKPQPFFAVESSYGLQKDDLSAHKQLMAASYPVLRRRNSAKSVFALPKPGVHSSAPIRLETPVSNQETNLFLRHERRSTGADGASRSSSIVLKHRKHTSKQVES